VAPAWAVALAAGLMLGIVAATARMARFTLA
jgi:hypothetical protein